MKNLDPVTIPTRPRGLRFEIAALLDARFEVRADAATIEIFGAVGLDVTPARIAGALRSIGNQRVTVQINSPGGDVFDGLTIFNLLRGHSPGVTTQIVGLAASAASLIAMAGNEVQIARAAQVMIHTAHGGVLGNASDMRQMASVLEQIDGVMAGIYQARTGLPLAQITAMMGADMGAGTFLTGQDALDLGFADALLDRDAAPPPRAAAGTLPSKREFERELRSRGFSHSIAAEMVAAAWPAAQPRERQREPESEIDLNAIANAIAVHVAAIVPRRNR